LTASETVRPCYPENKWRSDKVSEEEFHRRKKKAGFTMNGNLPPGGTKYTGLGTGNTWQHDMFDQHEKNFEVGYGSNGNSTNGSFMQPSAPHNKPKGSYYAKKPAESARTRPPIHGGSYRQGREREHDFVDIE
jgi:hypothetical protein